MNRLLIICMLGIIMTGCLASLLGRSDATADTTPKTTTELVQEGKALQMLKGNSKLSVGIAIAVAGFMASLFLVNPVVQKVGNYVMIAGGSWAIAGIVQIAVAVTYVYLLIGVIVAGVALLILYVCRDKGLENLFKKKEAVADKAD